MLKIQMDLLDDYDVGLYRSVRTYRASLCYCPFGLDRVISTMPRVTNILFSYTRADFAMLAILVSK